MLSQTILDRTIDDRAAEFVLRSYHGTRWANELASGVLLKKEIIKQIQQHIPNFDIRAPKALSEAAMLRPVQKILLENAELLMQAQTKEMDVLGKINRIVAQEKEILTNAKIVDIVYFYPYLEPFISDYYQKETK